MAPRHRQGLAGGPGNPGPDPLWYKDAVIYQLHVKAFQDSNGDGVGDFAGLSERLDYIASLGVNTIWLLPFYPSPMRDDGYDVADYRGIAPGYGTRSDFRRFIRQAHRRGLRVITELVINHTSDQHPWFQASRRAPPGSAKRNYYVWSDSDEKYAGTRVIFSDTETSNWTWDPVARQYYWHRFFSHQPDLNFDNPSVVKAVIRVMRFWLDMGVDGLRLDAIPYLCEREGTSNENLPETHQVLKHLRAVVDAHYADRLLLAEANQWPEDVREYFGTGDECHMAYHFPLMPRMYMALAVEDRYPVVEILEQTPAIPETCQWAIFLRNHDELTLEMVTDEERDYLYQTYASDPRARINVGIRRRLAPLLDNDPARIKLLNSLLLSMPGSPVLYYGDEIAMGDNIFLGDRNGVRTPMQWSPDRNAGFSSADPQALYLPPIMDPLYGYQSVNVEAQARDSSSLLNWTRRMLAVRSSHRVFGRGSLTLLAPGNRHVLAYLREYQDAAVLCVANLARTAQPVELDLARFRGQVPLEMTGRSPFPPIGDLPYMLTLAGHGFFWFDLSANVAAPDWHREALPRSALVTLVLRQGWHTFLPERLPPAQRASAAEALQTFTQRALPAFLHAHDWLPEPVDRVRPVRIQRRVLWQAPAASYLFLWAGTGDSPDPAQTCFVALAMAWGGDSQPRVRPVLAAALARVREHARVGVLHDAFHDGDFCSALLTAMTRGESVTAPEGTLRFSATALGGATIAGLLEGIRWQPLPGEDHIVQADRPVRLLTVRCGQSLTTELSMTRLLTEQGRFRNFPRLLGALALVAPEESASEGSTPLVLAQELGTHQGDAWRHLLLYLERFLDDARLRPLEETQPLLDDRHAAIATWLECLGQRVGELHLALVDTDDASFAPRPAGRAEVRRWIAAVRERADATLDALHAAAASLPEPAARQAAELLDRKRDLRRRIAAAAVGSFRGTLIRCHGRLELNRVLVAQNDAIIAGFHPDPAAEAWGGRHVPLKDVATLLCSLERVALTALQEPALGDAQTARILALDWLARARQAFLAGYVTGSAGADLYGPTPADLVPVVDLFMTDAALGAALEAARAVTPERADLWETPLAALLRRLDQPVRDWPAGPPPAVGP